MRRVFAAYLAGHGDRAIANQVNREGVPCPLMNRSGQNRHRLADGCQGSAIRSILENPKYTGYAIFGLSACMAWMVRLPPQAGPTADPAGGTLDGLKAVLRERTSRAND